MALLDRPLGDSRTPDQRRAARVAAGIVDTVGILSTRSHRVAYERHQTGTRGIGDVAHPDPPEPLRVLHLDRDGDDALARPSPRLPAAVEASDKALIHLDGARQRLALGSHHRHPVALEHRPGHSVARAQRAFEGLRRQTVLRCGQVPRGLKPCRQRRSRLVENRACTDRRLMATRRADQPPSRLAPRYSAGPARWAGERRWPPQMLQVRAARFFVREHPHELAVRARVVTSGQQQPDTGGVVIRRVHHYILWQEELTVHPLCRDIPAYLGSFFLFAGNQHVAGARCRRPRGAS